MREFLKGLELDKETIDTIMAEHGKLITEAKEKSIENEDKIKTYEEKIVQLEELAKTNESLKTELDGLKTSMAEQDTKRKQQEEDNIITNNIKSVFGERKFVNEFTENAILNEIKTALKDVNNTGKSAKDIFESLTKDKDGIFANPNPVLNIPGVGGLGTSTDKKEIPTIW